MAESKKAPRYGSEGRPTILGSNTARIPNTKSAKELKKAKKKAD